MARKWFWVLSSVVIGLLGLVAVLKPPAAHADIFCVTPAPGTPIGNALTAAAAGDTIRVAEGDYVENLLIDKNITLEGGWNGTCSARDVVANVTTILPADETQSVVAIQGNPADPATIAPVLDGFTITGGRADLGGNHGGGLKIVDSNAIVSNNVISGNAAALLGGGIWVQRGGPHLENNRIENNLSTGTGLNAYGGGVQLEESQATLIGNIIANNRVQGNYAYGGGVDVTGGGPITLEGNSITGNSIMIVDQNVARGGGIALLDTAVSLNGNLIGGNVITGFIGFGGGLLADGSQITMTDNLFEDNVASANGYGSGGGVALFNSQATLEGDLIRSNLAAGGNGSGSGGGIELRDSTAILDNVRIEENRDSENGAGYGGGLYAAASEVTLTRAWIRDNVSTSSNAQNAAGLTFVDTDFTVVSSIIAHNESANAGGVSASYQSRGQIFNSTFVANDLVAVWAIGDSMVASTTLKVLNTILTGHEVAIAQSGQYLTLDVTYSSFHENDVDAQGFTLDPATNFFMDPELTADFHLAPSSPMIDAGLGLVVYDRDIDGEPRVMAGPNGLYLIDVGADEHPGPVQVYRELAEQPADFTLIGPGGPLEDANAMGQNDWIGNALLGGDVNGDDRDDLVVGARTHTDVAGTIDDGGRVYALYNNGSRRTGTYDFYDQPSDLEVRSYLHQQHIGFSLATADLDNSDSYDLIVGSVGGMDGNQPITGTVYAFAGGADLSGVKSLSPTIQADWRFKSSESTQSFSELGALATGELNGSGPDDLVIGEPLATGPGNRLSAGAVHVFFGGTLPALWDLAQTAASMTIYGPAADAELGLVAIGDVDGDGQADLVARGGTAAYVFYGPLSSGAVDLATTPAGAAITGLNFGPLTLGDVDGDGKADLLLGDGEDVLLVRGDALPPSQTGTQAQWARFTGLGSMSSFVRLHALDWNGDGRDEIVVGDAQVNMTYVVFGQESFIESAPILARANWIIEGAQADEQLGFSLGSGDLDDDGGQDLIVGSRSYDAPDHPAFFEDAGAVYVFYGSPAVGPDPDPTTPRVLLPAVFRP